MDRNSVLGEQSEEDEKESEKWEKEKQADDDENETKEWEKEKEDT